MAVEIAENLPALFADERAIKQIELNLLSNAVKFTPAGGNVVMRVAMLENGAMELSVADTGRGIPTDQLPLVMQPFHQVSGPLTRETGGTGLGLPLCASLVALHGGRMHVDSEVDKGTSVTITFPAERIRP